jgi:hypothetical protein
MACQAEAEREQARIIKRRGEFPGIGAALALIDESDDPFVSMLALCLGSLVVFTGEVPPRRLPDGGPEVYGS